MRLSSSGFHKSRRLEPSSGGRFWTSFREKGIRRGPNWAFPVVDLGKQTVVVKIASNAGDPFNLPTG